MATDLIMPKLGLTMDEGTLVRWLVAAGDMVQKGQPVLDVETDKVTVEVEATASGVMGPLLVAEGQTVPVTTLLARILAPGEEALQRDDLGQESPAEAREAPGPRITPLARRVAEQEKIDLSSIPVREPAERIRARDVREASAQGRTRRSGQDRPVRQHQQRVFSSPRARKRAREMGIDWRSLAGSGPQGRVVEKDVLRAAQATLASSVLASERDERDVTWEVPTKVQRITAERMVTSFGSAPHFYLSAEVRADALLDLRARLLPTIERRVGVRLTITDLLLRIVGTSLAEYPRANGFWDEGRIGLHRQVNVGVAVATDEGLVVPVLRQADHKTLSEIARERVRLVEKARAGALSPDDVSGGTFTLTNLGMFRVDTFQAILNPPQSAILAVGRVVERPAVVDGEVQVCRMAVLSLSCDHRVLDGALAAQFLGRVAELIEEPYGLLA
jgi:pyruvate dehydrogenase E2 component (dihydrolipoamide acetyltransferase)